MIRTSPHKNNLLIPLVLLLAVSSRPARADYSSTVLSQQPVGYWRLNETASPPVTPILATNTGSVGAAGNGTYIDCTRGALPSAIVSEPANRAVHFDGLDGSDNRVR